MASTEPIVNRDRSNGNLRPWKPGQSGNPKGRKPIAPEVREMLESAVPEVVQQLTWAIFEDAHIKAIGEIIGSGSPRVTAIVGGALLDDTLRRTLSERFRNDNDITKKLLRVNGPLGNTVPKIDVLYQLSAIEKPVRNALYGLSTIRNVFAHNLSASFDLKTREMLGAITLLTLHESRKVYPHQIYDGETKIPIEVVLFACDRLSRADEEGAIFEPRTAKPRPGMTRESLSEPVRAPEDQRLDCGFCDLRTCICFGQGRGQLYAVHVTIAGDL